MAPIEYQNYVGVQIKIMKTCGFFPPDRTMRAYPFRVFVHFYMTILLAYVSIFALQYAVEIRSNINDATRITYHGLLISQVLIKSIVINVFYYFKFFGLVHQIDEYFMEYYPLEKHRRFIKKHVRFIIFGCYAYNFFCITLYLLEMKHWFTGNPDRPIQIPFHFPGFLELPMTLYYMVVILAFSFYTFFSVFCFPTGFFLQIGLF